MAIMARLFTVLTLFIIYSLVYAQSPQKTTTDSAVAAVIEPGTAAETSEDPAPAQAEATDEDEDEDEEPDC